MLSPGSAFPGNGIRRGIIHNMSDKIINTLQQRLQLERAIDALGETTTESDLGHQVQAIVDRYDADAILAVLVKKLDVPNGQLRGGLGQIAAMLPHKQSGAALRAAAANRNHSAQTRLTAALLMRRFLDQELPQALLADLDDPDQVVMQSLQEAIEEGRENRYVLLEYVRQMRHETEDVAHMVMGLMDELDPVDRAGLLRLIATDDRTQVARSAIKRLGEIRDKRGGPHAVRALHALQPNLPPAQADQAVQLLRRLRFSGIRYAPESDHDWRGLIGPADPSGNQTIWFVRPPQNGGPGGQSELGKQDGQRQPNGGEGDDGVLLGVHINPLTGVMEAFGHEQMEASLLPAPRPEGQLVSVDAGNGRMVVLLEAPFDFARWRLQAALTAHWQVAAPEPLPDEYRLYSDHIWDQPPPQVPVALSALFQPDPDLWEESSRNVNLGMAADRVLQHPAMAGWFFHGQNLLRYVRTRPDLSQAPGIAQMVKGLLREVFANGENIAGLLAGVEAGLRAQSAWLHLAGSRETARQAQILAESLRHLPPEQNPLLARMAEMGIRFALERMPS